MHKKDKIDAYLALMIEENSLDTIRDTLKINKKTAFDWRHKILSSLSDPDQTNFSGITKSDETVFLNSKKGSQNLSRNPCKRGGRSREKGPNNEHVAVIVTQD